MHILKMCTWFRINSGSVTMLQKKFQHPPLGEQVDQWESHWESKTWENLELTDRSDGRKGVLGQHHQSLNERWCFVVFHVNDLNEWAVRWATGLPHFNQARISQVGSLPGYCSSLLSGACRGSLLLVCLIWEMLSDVPVNCSSFPGLKLHAGRESSPDSLTWVPHESKPRGERTACSLQFLQGMACSCLCLRYLLLQKCLQTHWRKPLNMAEQLSHFHFKMGYAEKESWEVLESGNKGKHFLPLLLLFSCSVVSYSLRPHELQHTRLPCPSPSPGFCSNSCSLSQRCHPSTSSSVIPFSCPQSFPPSVSFPMNWFLTSGGQSIGVSASASVLPMNIQD